MPTRSDGLCRNGLHSVRQYSVRQYGQLRCQPCRQASTAAYKATPREPGQWGRPIAVPERHARFAAYAAGLGAAIAETRWREGIDSSRGDRWQTFGGAS